MTNNPFEKFTKAAPPEEAKAKFDKFAQAQQERVSADKHEAFAKFKIQRPGRTVSQPAPTPSSPAPQAPKAAAGTGSLSSFLSFDEKLASSAAPSLARFERRESPLSAFPRMGDGEQKIFSENWPQVVALTRAQSGVGLLEISLAATPGLMLSLWVEDSEKRIFRVASGMQTQEFAAVSPTGSIFLHLRHSERLRRALVVVTAQSPATLWEGALTTTIRRAKITASLERATPCENFVPLSILQVEGELVLRFENAFQDSPLRDVLESFGYREITWKNNRTPLL